GVSSSFSYDRASQLLTLTHSGGQSINIPLAYSYDSVGTRTTQSTSVGQPLTTQAVANTFDNANRLLSNGSSSYTYDANGNLASSTGPAGTTNYTWDSRNRLLSIAAPGQTTTFVYDFAGNLISENQSGSVNLLQDFVLDDLTNIAFVSRSNSDNLSVLAGRSIDQHVATVHSSGQVEYGLTDAINSAVATVDQTGKQLASFFYEPFGWTTTTSSYTFEYTGRVHTVGTLYNYRARVFDYSIGRFVSEDPATPLPAYAYVMNSPLSLTDPLGLQVQVSGGLGGTLGLGSPFTLFAGFFATGGVNVGVTSSGTYLVQIQVGGGPSFGAYAGGGYQLSVSPAASPLPLGFSGEVTPFGTAIASVGAVNFSVTGFPGGGSVGFKGPGLGVLAGGGLLYTGTFAFPGGPINSTLGGLFNPFGLAQSIARLFCH
ncbi:MAG: RHS repeat-associated core domain-containing protein, partial [Terriglobia bacterium]